MPGRDAEARYRAVFQFSSDPIYIADLDTLEILEANCAFLELLGYAGEGLPAGLRAYDFVAHDPASIDRNARAIRDEGRALMGERRWRRRDGSLLHVEVHGMQVPFQGRPCYCVLAHDVTARARHEEELRRQNRILAVGRRIDRLLAGCLELPELARMLARALGRLYPVDALLITRCSPRTDADVLAVWPPEAAVVASREVRSGAIGCLRHAAREGTPGARRVLVPLFHGRKPFGMLILHSSSQRELRDESLAVLDLVAPQVAAAVSTTLALREREELSRIKSEFVAIASHELRTPLSVVKGYARMLTSPEFSTDEAERRTYLERLYDGCDRLSRLVDDLLDAARLEDGRINLRTEPVHLAGLLEGVAAVLEQRYGKPPRLPAGDRVVAADPQALDRVIVNLLDNAFKYSDTGRPPEVRWRNSRSAARQGVEVINDGAAFSAEELSRLFQRFGRLPRHASQPGTGLGLYAARALVEQMGGAMGVEASNGQVAFWFELRASSAAPAPGRSRT